MNDNKGGNETHAKKNPKKTINAKKYFKKITNTKKKY